MGVMAMPGDMKAKSEQGRLRPARAHAGDCATRAGKATAKPASHVERSESGQVNTFHLPNEQ
jgi:hypothetical protein